MDGWKGHRSRRMGTFMFQKETVFGKEKGGIKEVPGRYGFWEKMVGLGESTSRNPERKKGHAYPSVLKKFYKSGFKCGNGFCHSLKKENYISNCLFQQRYRDVVFSMSKSIVCEN